jgi:hypothetical protein
LRKIKLTKGKWALVDDADFERVNAHKWYASIESRGTKWYAKRACRRHEYARWKTDKIRMHHFVVDICPVEMPAGIILDHRDDNGLNMQRLNLQWITQEQNMKKCPGWKSKDRAYAPRKRRR